MNEQFNIKHIVYNRPELNQTLQEYAQCLAEQIDTSRRFILIGVSLGGMIATEISQFTHPEKTIVISSAKNRNELPSRYTFQEKFPIYKLISPKLAKAGSKILQPIVEPDRRLEKEIFKNMLNDKDAVFLRRTIKMIINWDRTEMPKNIVHIHGSNDHTIPHKNVDCDYLIENGSHMMVLTRGKEISSLLNKILVN